MTAQALRQTLLAMRKEVRKSLSLLRSRSIEQTFKASLSDNEASFFCAVLFGLASEMGSTADYAFTQSVASATFAKALPPPDLDSDMSEQCEKLVKRLTPHVISLDEFAFGWFYQIFCEQARAASQAAFQQSNKKCSQSERIAFTQIYTPRWVSDFLAESCLSSSKNKSAERITVIDPACGAGNILLSALEMLSTANLRNGVENPFGVAATQVYGTDIDPIALFVTHVSIICRIERAGGQLVGSTNLKCVGDTILGSLAPSMERDDLLGTTYDAVITNPPYIGRKLLDHELKEQLKQHYPTVRSDLSAAFLLRGLELLKPNGTLGLITQTAHFFLPSFATMRKKLLESYHIDTFVECGSGAFPLQTGEKVNSSLVVIKNLTTQVPSRFIDLSQSISKDEALKAAISDNKEPGNEPAVATVKWCDQQQFLRQEGHAFNYKLPPFLLRLPRVSTPLSQLADLRQGLATTNNARFVRNWWDVPAEEIGARWVPYVKGAGSERWWSPIDTVVLWENEGSEIKQAVSEAYPYLKGNTAWVVKNESHYFKTGLVFSFVNTRQFCARFMPAGCIFDVAASAIFPTGSPYFLLAYLNSSFCALQANILNPTINFQIGDLKKLSVPSFSAQTLRTLEELGKTCVKLKELLTKARGTVCGAGSYSVNRDPPIDLESWRRKSEEVLRGLSDAEQQIDSLVLNEVVRLLDLSTADASELAELCAVQQSKRRRPAIFPDTAADLVVLQSRRSVTSEAVT